MALYVQLKSLQLRTGLTGCAVVCVSKWANYRTVYSAHVTTDLSWKIDHDLGQTHVHNLHQKINLRPCLTTG